MKLLIAAAIALAASGAGVAGMIQGDYPSCDLAAQRRLKGQIGGRIENGGQAHVSMRANILQADLGNARKARRLTQEQADTLFQRVEQARRSTDRFVRKQGFLSAGERISQDRELDAVALRLCRA